MRVLIKFRWNLIWLKNTLNKKKLNTLMEKRKIHYLMDIYLSVFKEKKVFFFFLQIYISFFLKI
jgi:hypothetical protein